MIVKKRGFFLSKKGDATHESAQIMLWALFLAVFAFILFGFVNTVRSGTVFEKNYIARDLAMVVNTVYASPQDLVYVYPTNTSLFYVTIKDHKVRVTDVAMEPESVDKIYWYADENQSMLNIEEPFERVDNLKFIKTQVNDEGDINIVRTVLEFPPVYTIWQNPLLR
ncbi:hypothetical protein A3K72_00820 [Candidatus Woesearchaeota archaeon RBG_13_36_6]|nr:MAG: hypothetical protein A3K72_00820 [Candidatus Woesearchaeota archaeon RBG_13_36_6]